MARFDPQSYDGLDRLGRIALSESFHLREFLYSEIAVQYQLRNVPEKARVQTAVDAGSKLCELLLEPLRPEWPRQAWRPPPGLQERQEPAWLERPPGRLRRACSRQRAPGREPEPEPEPELQQVRASEPGLALVLSCCMRRRSGWPKRRPQGVIFSSLFLFLGCFVKRSRFRARAARRSIQAGSAWILALPLRLVLTSFVTMCVLLREVRAGATAAFLRGVAAWLAGLALGERGCGIARGESPPFAGGAARVSVRALAEPGRGASWLSAGGFVCRRARLFALPLRTSALGGRTAVLSWAASRFVTWDDFDRDGLVREAFDAPDLDAFAVGGQRDGQRDGRG